MLCKCICVLLKYIYVLVNILRVIGKCIFVLCKCICVLLNYIYVLVNIFCVIGKCIFVLREYTFVL